MHDLTIHPRENDLVLATYGRALWTGDITPLQELSAEVLDKPVHLFDIEPRARYGFSTQGMNYHLFGDKYLEVPNEPDALVINYYLKADAAAGARIAHRRRGRPADARRWQGPARAGLNRVTVSLAGGGGQRGRGRGRRGRRGAVAGALTVGDYVGHARRSARRVTGADQAGARARSDSIADGRRDPAAIRGSSSTSPTHAGGVVVRGDGAELRVLLVTAQAAAEPVGVPEGTHRNRRNVEQAAIREVEEEAGVVATVGEPIGALEFRNARGLVRAQFFLMAFVSEGAPREDRRRAWFTAEEARQALGYEDARMLVDQGQTGLDGDALRSRAAAVAAEDTCEDTHGRMASSVRARCVAAGCGRRRASRAGTPAQTPPTPAARRAASPQASGRSRADRAATRPSTSRSWSRCCPKSGGWTRGKPKGEQLSMGVADVGAPKPSTRRARRTIDLEITDYVVQSAAAGADRRCMLAAGYSERSSDGYKKAASARRIPGLRDVGQRRQSAPKSPSSSPTASS